MKFLADSQKTNYAATMLEMLESSKTKACKWEVGFEGKWNGAYGTWVGRCRRVSLAGLRRHIGSIHRCFDCVEVRFLLELTNVLLVAYSLVAKPIRDLRDRWMSDIQMHCFLHINLAVTASLLYLPRLKKRNDLYSSKKRLINWSSFMNACMNACLWNWS